MKFELTAPAMWSGTNTWTFSEDEILSLVMAAHPEIHGPNLRVTMVVRWRSDDVRGIEGREFNVSGDVDGAWAIDRDTGKPIFTSADQLAAAIRKTTTEQD